MARTKANSSASTEKITTVEATEKEVAEKTETTASEVITEDAADTKTEKKIKEYKDDDKVKIKSLYRAGMKVIGLDINNPIQFDENGVAETSGKEANRLLKIPGYVLA